MSIAFNPLYAIDGVKEDIILLWLKYF